MMGTAMRLPGGGPWLIKDDCGAWVHNTLEAARGRDTRYRTSGSRKMKHKCECPRALILVEHDRIRRRRTPKTKPEAMVIPEVITPPVERGLDAAVTPKVPMPDLSQAACRTKEGRAVVDRVLDSSGGLGTRARIEHVQMCDTCPVLQQCRDFVLDAERPRGAWVGVWGGLIQSERRMMRG